MKKIARQIELIAGPEGTKPGLPFQDLRISLNVDESLSLRAKAPWITANEIPDRLPAWQVKG